MGLHLPPSDHADSHSGLCQQVCGFVTAFCIIVSKSVVQSLRSHISSLKLKQLSKQFIQNNKVTLFIFLKKNMFLFIVPWVSPLQAPLFGKQTLVTILMQCRNSTLQLSPPYYCGQARRLLSNCLLAWLQWQTDKFPIAGNYAKCRYAEAVVKTRIIRDSQVFHEYTFSSSSSSPPFVNWRVCTVTKVQDVNSFTTSTHKCAKFQGVVWEWISLLGKLWTHAHLASPERVLALTRCQIAIARYNSHDEK